MTNIAKFFIENAKLTIVLSVGLVLFGYQGLKKMNSESYPAVSFAMAMITTSYDGATASDIEVKITKPLEDEIRGVSGLKDVRSTSQAGLSKIVIRADMDNPKVNVDEVMNEVEKAIDRVTNLPRDLQDSPKFTEIKSEEFPVLEVAIVGGNHNRQRDKIADLLKEDFEDNRSVKGVTLTGFQERAFNIFLNLKKMKEFHISLDEVLDRIKARNTNTPGGGLKGDGNQKLVRIESKISNRQELENIIIRSNFSGKLIKLLDIGNIEDSQEEPIRFTRYNGKESTLIIVNKKAGADTIEMVHQLNSILKSYTKRYPDYKFNIYNSEGIKVKDRVDILTSNALTGLVLVFVFLFFFLPGKIGFVASLSLPLAMLGTMGVMPMFGMNLDAITILALVIALGMMVDNSVVISENFTRLRYEGVEPITAATQSIKSLWLPITATAFTTMAAFLPMLVTKGIMGEFIRWIPIVVTIALLLSLLESFFFLPMRLRWAGHKFKQTAVGKNTDWFSRFEKIFENFMKVVVRRRYIVAFLFTGIIAFSLYMTVVVNKFILFPAEQTEIYIGRLEMTKGTTLDVTHKRLEDISLKVQEALGKDVIHIVTRAGVSQTDPTDPKALEGDNVGMISIYVSEYAKNNIPYTEVLKSLKKIHYTDIDSLTFEELVNGPPVGNAIEATFRSNSAGDIDRMISLIIEELKKYQGIENLKINDIVGDDEVFVHIDYEKTARLGINVANVGAMIRAAIAGERVSNVTLDNKDIDLIVRLDKKERKGIKDLEKVLIQDMRGNLIPLKRIARFERLSGTPHIKRYDFKRSKTLTGDVDAINMTSVRANKIVLDTFNKNKDQFPGMNIAFGGAQEATNESLSSLASAFQLSLIGIFAILVFLLKSYLRPIIIMTTIPLGFLGFSVAFFLHGRPVSFMSLIGVIALGGIIVNSGIVLISFIDEMREKGVLSLEDILAKASGMRLRAVFVTSLTTISGLLPTAYGIGGNDAMLVPMTLAMAWGLTSGTVLTLVWTPAAYAILEDWSSLLKRIFLKKS